LIHLLGAAVGIAYTAVMVMQPRAAAGCMLCWADLQLWRAVAINEKELCVYMIAVAVNLSTGFLDDDGQLHTVCSTFSLCMSCC
jgi:hypothetical protein